MGKYDLPAMIDYVLNKTNEKQIQFIGHSQGGTTLYVAMSIRPEYNEKIRLVSLLAPGGFFNKLPHPFYKLFALFEKQIQVTQPFFSVKLQYYHNIILSIFIKKFQLLNCPCAFSLHNFSESTGFKSAILVPFCKNSILYVDP